MWVNMCVSVNQMIKYIRLNLNRTKKLKKIENQWLIYFILKNNFKNITSITHIILHDWWYNNVFVIRLNKL